MRQLPSAAQFYIGSVIVLGVFATGYAVARDLAAYQSDLNYALTLLVLSVATIVASLLKVQISGKRHATEGNTTVTLGIIPIFYALLYLNPLAGLITGTINALVGTCYPRRSPMYQVLFSVAALMISVEIAGIFLQSVGCSHGNYLLKSVYAQNEKTGFLLFFLSSLAATTIFFVINSVLVGTAVALSSKSSPWIIWRQHFLWTSPGFFAGASIGSILFFTVGAFYSDPKGIPSLIFAGGILLAALPIVAMLFFYLRTHMKGVHAQREYIETLEEKNALIEASRNKLSKLFTEVVESLALAIDAKDHYTHEHILSVQTVASSIAEEMGMQGVDLEGVETASLLHDIGKLGVPEHILVKPGKLTEDEYEAIKKHPDMGAKILEPVTFPWPVIASVRHHHERWDGKGYPDGLEGELIPIGARILAIADVFAALTSDRSYRKSWTRDEAMQYISNNSGTHFDPHVVQAFMSVMERDPNLGVERRLQTLDFMNEASSLPLSEARSDAARRIVQTSQEYRWLFEMAQSVSDTLDLDDTLGVLVDKIVKQFNASTCVIFLRDVSGLRLRARRAEGLNNRAFEGVETPLGIGLTGLVAISGEAVLLPYSDDDLMLCPHPESWTPLRSALILPLMAERELLGTINLYQETENAFTNEDLLLMQQVTTQAGRAIQNALNFERTRESALTDSLTGLYNARQLGLVLDEELYHAEAERREMAVLMIDLDDFKRINDTHGHLHGNKILHDLGEIFQTTLRSRDLVARYAGDEFVIVLPSTGSMDAHLVADKIRTAVDEYGMRQTQYGKPVGFSVGVAVYPHDAQDADSLIAYADNAMYGDKARRKGFKTAPAFEVPSATQLQSVGRR